MKPPETVTLTGHHVRLEPLAEGHAEGLFAVVGPPNRWKYMPRPGFADVEEVRAWISETLESASRGVCLPFAVMDLQGDVVAGTTRYLDLRVDNDALEIGWTWLGEQYFETNFNTESKFLLLKHAFDDLGAVRVQMKIDARNKRSRKAIERSGALFEGILRSHLRRHDGRLRDTAYFSIISDEWPAVRQRLEERLHWGD